LDEVEVCKDINGVKECGLRRKEKKGKIIYVRRKSPFKIEIFRKKACFINKIRNAGDFTKFTRNGSSWEKKTIKINDAVRNAILEESVTELMKDAKLNKEITKGKVLDWKQKIAIIEKKEKVKFYKQEVQLLRSAKGKALIKKFKNSVKIEKKKKVKL